MKVFLIKIKIFFVYLGIFQIIYFDYLTCSSSTYVSVKKSLSNTNTKYYDYSSYCTYYSSYNSTYYSTYNLIITTCIIFRTCNQNINLINYLIELFHLVVMVGLFRLLLVIH